MLKHYYHYLKKQIYKFLLLACAFKFGHIMAQFFGKTPTILAVTTPFLIWFSVTFIFGGALLLTVLKKSGQLEEN